MSIPKPQFKSEVLGNYIDGRFELPKDAQGEWTHRSPANTRDELGKWSYSYRSVDAAVEAADRAFAIWRKKPLTERMELLKKYQAQLKAREAELTEVLAREVGKPLWESKTEVSAMVNKIDVTLQDSLKLVADLHLPNVLEGTQGVSRYKPHGVMAVIGPFNFPGHLPNGHIVPALVMGNTIVFKPSEKRHWSHRSWPSVFTTRVFLRAW